MTDNQVQVKKLLEKFHEFKALNRVEEAKALAHKAFALDKSNLNVLRCLLIYECSPVLKDMAISLIEKKCQEYDKSSPKESEFTETIVLSAAIFREQNMICQSYKLLTNSLEFISSSRNKNRILFELGLSYRIGRQFYVALDYFHQIDNYESDPRVLHEIANCWLYTGNFEEIIKLESLFYKLSNQLLLTDLYKAKNNLKASQKLEEALTQKIKISSWHEIIENKNTIISGIKKLRRLSSFSIVDDLLLPLKDELECKPTSILELANLYLLNKANIWEAKGELNKSLEIYQRSASILHSVEVYSKIVSLLNRLNKSEEIKIFQDKLLENCQDWSLIKEYIQKYIPKINLNHYLITVLLHGNIGDTTKFLSVIDSLSCQQGKKVILIIRQGYSSNIKKLCTMFDSPQIEKIIEVPLTSESYKFVFTPIKPGVPIGLYIEPTTIREFIPNRTTEYIKLAEITNDFDCVKQRLNLPLNSWISYPKIKQSSLYKANDLFRDFNLKPGKTILLAPISNSYNSIYHTNETFKNFWKTLGTFFAQKGFLVVINSKNHNDTQLYTIPNCRNIYIELDLIIPFCNAGGFFIGMRSGLCELLTFATNCRKLVIYPPGSKNPTWINKGLRPYGFYEQVIDPNNFEISQVVNIFDVENKL